VNVKYTVNLRHLYSKQRLLFVSLLFVLVLVSSGFVSAFSNVSLFVLGASNKVVVSNEVDLKNAVNAASGSTTVALNNDITLTEQLVIPANKDIILTSASTSKFFKLIGGDLEVYFAPDYWPSTGAVISVEGGAVLRLDGIVVSNPENFRWTAAVSVSVSGTFILCSGEISGYGVSNSGVFTMVGGTISNCIGGGVGNSGYGTFSMSGGEISNNPSFGVINSDIRNGITGKRTSGTFTMSGGVIRNNGAGGVQNTGIFSMSGGEISNNQATREGWNYLESGGGVSNSGIFSMSGGMISNNQATYGGGVYNWPDGNFSLSEKGVISNNNAEVGGGVYNVGTFSRCGGIISDNTANQYNDMYPNDDSITSYTVLVVTIVLIISIIVVAGLFISKRRNKNNNCQTSSSLTKE
jgi:hypothetical protein